MTDNHEDKYDIANRLTKEHGPLFKATRQFDYALDLLELAQEAFVSGGAMVTIGQQRHAKSIKRSRISLTNNR